MVGCYIKATVKHEEYESNKEPGKMLKSVRLNSYEVAIGFTAEPAADSAEDEEEDDIEDLDDFLND